MLDRQQSPPSRNAVSTLRDAALARMRAEAAEAARRQVPPDPASGIGARVSKALVSALARPHLPVAAVRTRPARPAPGAGQGLPDCSVLPGPALAQVIAVSFFINLLMLASPLYMLQVYDRVVPSGSVETLIYLSLACGGLLLAMGLLEAFRAQIANNLGAAHQAAWAPLVLDHLARKSGIGTARPDRTPLHDLDVVHKFVSSNVLLAFMDAPWTPLFLIALFVLHPWLGVVALAAAAILTGLALMTEALTRNLYQDAHQLRGRSNVLADSVLHNSDAVRAMGMLNAVRLRWHRAFDDGAHLLGRANDCGALMRGLAKFLRPLMQMAILGFGALLVIQGELSAGAMIAGSILMGRALAPIEQVVSNWRSIIQAHSAHGRLRAFIAGELRSEPQPMDQPWPSGTVSVDGVSVLNPATGKPILNRVSFALQAGEALAVVGPSGAGKSTLARVIAGALAPDTGCVRLDGVEQAHWPDRQRGRIIGFMPQNMQLCDGSIADNIARFEDGSDQAIHTAAEAANVSALVNHLPDGFMTEITSAGAPLSPGQCQRVALARALYGDPPFLVLDEPKSHLDSEGEGALIEAIAAARQRGATIVIVTHRASLLNQADKVLTLVGGQIQFFGDREGFLSRLAAAA
jgi:PrtD family type I secretion system ABC transporter